MQSYPWEDKRVDLDNFDIEVDYTYRNYGDGYTDGLVSQYTTTTYVWNGTQLFAEMTDSYVIVYLYEADGSPIGMQYLNLTSTTAAWEIYWYLKRTVLMC